MDKEKLKEGLKKEIRSLLVSAPRGVPANLFAKDYRSMNGKELPFRDLGYARMEDFILSIPDVVRVGNGPTGLPTFFPVATRETQHMVSLVSRQKKPALKKSMAPSAIVAPKIPPRTSAFSKKNRYNYRPDFRYRENQAGYRKQCEGKWVGWVSVGWVWSG